MKKVFALILAALITVCLAACGDSLREGIEDGYNGATGNNSGSSSEVNAQDNIIGEIKLASIEDGIAYYDVYLIDSVEWPQADSQMEIIAKNCISDCVDLARSESASGVSIFGYIKGIQCFSWDGVNAVRYYDQEGKFTHEYYLSTAELSEFSLE